jgi:hypothetical protein
VLAWELDKHPSIYTGKRARVTRHERIDTGRLFRAKDPTYKTMDVWIWYLAVPTLLPEKFGVDAEDALSLQWAGNATVEFLDESEIL